MGFEACCVATTDGFCVVVVVVVDVADAVIISSGIPGIGLFALFLLLACSCHCDFLSDLGRVAVL